MYPFTRIAEAAIASIGHIGREQATSLLAAGRDNVADELRGKLTESLLSCADRFLQSGQADSARTIYGAAFEVDQPIQIRVAAFHGLIAADAAHTPESAIALLNDLSRELQIAAVGALRTLTGNATTRALVDQLPSLPASYQALLLNVLGDRDDSAALSAVLEAVDSDDADVRTAALSALGSLGDAGAVRVLTQSASKAVGEERAAARTSLGALKRPDVDAEIRSLLCNGNEAAVLERIACLGPRNAGWAVDLLRECLRRPDRKIHIASLRALGDLATAADFPILMEQLVQAKDAEIRECACDAVLAATLRNGNTDQRTEEFEAALSAGNQPETKIAILQLLSRIGGTRAMAAVSAQTREKNAAISRAAVTALVDWRDMDAMQNLLRIVRTSDNPDHRAAALQGYVRLLRRIRPRTSKELLAQYREVFGLATRVQEKKQILSGLRSVRIPAALKFVLRMLKDEELGDDAAMTVVYLSGLGRETEIGDENAVVAVKCVLANSENEEVRRMAEMVLQTRLRSPR